MKNLAILVIFMIGCAGQQTSEPREMPAGEWSGFSSEPATEVKPEKADSDLVEYETDPDVERKIKEFDEKIVGILRQIEGCICAIDKLDRKQCQSFGSDYKPFADMKADMESRRATLFGQTQYYAGFVVQLGWCQNVLEEKKKNMPAQNPYTVPPVKKDKNDVDFGVLP